jgi:protein SCO1/2
MSTSPNYKGIVMLITLIVAAGAGYISSKHFFADPKNQLAEYKSLLVYPGNKTFSGFELIDINNQKLTIDSFADKWTLLFFGFTHCPDVCPTTLSELQKTFQLLKNKNLKQLPEVLFVSVDPERDQPENLKEYIGFFNQKFNAATADKANLLSLTSQVGVAYHIGEHQQGDSNYSVDHTAAIFLVSPEKLLYGLFRSPHQATNIADDLQQLIGSK